MKTNRKSYESPSMTKHTGLVEIAVPKHELTQGTVAQKPLPIRPAPAPKDR